MDARRQGHLCSLVLGVLSALVLFLAVGGFQQPTKPENSIRVRPVSGRASSEDNTEEHRFGLTETFCSRNSSNRGHTV